MTGTEIYENNLQHFQVTKRYGDKAQCKCPAHDDRQASLTITKGEKCTLFRCHAGCTLDNILSAAGLEKKDTFYDSEIPKQSTWQFYVESREKRKIEAVYNYVSCNDSYAYTKIRLSGKKFIKEYWRMIALHMDYQEIHQENLLRRYTVTLKP